MNQEASPEAQWLAACQQIEELARQTDCANLSPALAARLTALQQTLAALLAGSSTAEGLPSPAPATETPPPPPAWQHRHIQLQTAAEISKQASMILDPAQLMFQAVNLIRERFNFYYVGLFIWYKNTNQAVLTAATGTAGQQMLLAGHRLEVGGNSMIGWCIANAKPRLALDVGKEAIRFDNPYLPETRSELALPLISRGKCIGALTVQSKEEAAFSAEDVTVLQSMADLLAIAIENAWLYEAAQREITERKHIEEAIRQRNRELIMLQRATQAMISHLDLDETLHTVLEEVRRLLKVMASSVWLVDESTGELICRAATGPHKATVRQWRLAPGEGFVGWVVQHGQSLIIGDAQADPRHFHKLDELVGTPLASVLTIPLLVQNKVIGALQVVDTRPHRFNEANLPVLEPLAATAAMAIENARLYQQALQDAQTKQALLREVNHRVKNNLSAIIGILYAERRQLRSRVSTDTYEATMNDLIGRVQGLATVHNMLSGSEWAPLPLAELASQVIHSSLRALPAGQEIGVAITPSPVTVTPDQAHNLALIINELTTNTVKQALQCNSPLQIRVTIQENREIYFEFRDNGPGYPAEVLRLERHGVGLELLQEIVRKSLHGRLELYNDQGAVTVIHFPAEKQGAVP